MIVKGAEIKLYLTCAVSCTASKLFYYWLNMMLVNFQEGNKRTGQIEHNLLHIMQKLPGHGELLRS